MKPDVNQVKPERIALIDADLLVYRIGFAIESKIVSEETIDGEVWTTSTIEAEPLENALQIVKDTLDFIYHEIGATQSELYLTGKDNFREDIATVKKYKGNRDKARRPIHVDGIKQYLIKEHGAKVSTGQEADDELGIRLTEIGDAAILCTIDKDLLQVPGKHFNWVNGNKKLITPAGGIYQFYKQLLVGDAADNIPGCPSVGEKRAEKILDGVVSEVQMWNVVLNTYDEKMKKFCHKIVEGFQYDNGICTYPHWNGEKEMQVSLETYLTEIGRLLKIRQSRNEIWNPPEGED